MAGDQQAALFGQTGFDVGNSKCTYGTGAFILTNTGKDIVISNHGLLATVAWQSPGGEMTYASEGSVLLQVLQFSGLETSLASLKSLQMLKAWQCAQVLVMA
jgi:glycerol kinase